MVCGESGSGMVVRFLLFLMRMYGFWWRSCGGCLPCGILADVWEYGIIRWRLSSFRWLAS